MSLREDGPQGDEGLEAILAACIDAAESGDAVSVRTLLREHPEHADHLRRVLGNLVDMGLVDDEADPALDRAPPRIGPYVIEGELGRGGQGIVHRAHDSRLGRPVALKVLSTHGLVSEEAHERFRREAMVASRLSHPGLCTVYDTGAEDDRLWIAMELIEGESLAQRITAKKSEATLPGTLATETLAPVPTPDAIPSTVSQLSRPEIDEISRLFVEMARACHHAHEAGVIHRDLKPGNVMITPEGRPVILDFGLAGDETDASPTLTRTDQRFGTPAYMSPEQIDRSLHAIDRRTDVWSLGVSLFELLALRRPFEGATRLDLEAAILNTPPADLRKLCPSLPADLAIVVERALEKHPDDRYATAEAFAEDLRRVADREPILARPVSTATRLWRWVQRRPALAASLVAAFLFLSAGLVTSLILLADRTQALEDRDRTLAEYGRMSDASLSRRLLDEESQLWPALPHTRGALDSWIRRSREVLGRRDRHRTTWVTLRSRGRPVAAIAASEAGTVVAIPRDLADENSTTHLHFVDPEAAWRFEVLGLLLTDLERLEALQDRVIARHALASSIEQISIKDPAETWERCIQLVEDDPRFDEIVLDPQLGLVPLGRDRDSGLFEFWHVASGDRPTWTGPFENGKTTIDENSGLVLILVPGGRFLMGAQDQDPTKPHFDPVPMVGTSPPHPVRLNSYFLSKYEMTQAQWTRLMGHNPSYHQPGVTLGGNLMTPRNPVENVTWNDCIAALSRLDLTLPTEAQWERAIRAGTATRWFTGNDPDSLQHKANIADLTASRETRWNCTLTLDDGHLCHAPVDTHAPNPYGFHGMVGNVHEWTRCYALDYVSPILDLTGYRGDSLPEAGNIYRGSAYDNTPLHGRSAFRTGTHATTRDHNLGLRPARLVYP